jgi:hypothetical protein
MVKDLSLITLFLYKLHKFRLLEVKKHRGQNNERNNHRTNTERGS